MINNDDGNNNYVTYAEGKSSETHLRDTSKQSR